MVLKKKKVAEDTNGDEDYTYDVTTLARDMELEPASVRVKLRNAGIEKAGKKYGWNNKKEYEQVMRELEDAPASPPRKKAAPPPPPTKKKATLRRKLKEAEEAA